VAFAIAFGAITSFLSLLFILVSGDFSREDMFRLNSFLFLWVFVGMLVLTFGGPFVTAVDNGYYSNFFGLFGAVITVADVSKENNFTLKLNVLLSCSSLIVLIASGLHCPGGCTDIIAYQISLSAISLFFALLVVGLQTYEVETGFYQILAIFQFLWWIAGFVVLTFFGSFQSPTGLANGFFFTWISLALSTLLVFDSSQIGEFVFEEKSKRRSAVLLLLLGGSLINIGIGVRYYQTCLGSLTCASEVPISIYSFCLGVISTSVVILLFGLPFIAQSCSTQIDSSYSAILYFFTIWWLLGAFVMSFYSTSNWQNANDNGYFSLYFNLGLSLFLNFD
jgi:hypothetical protein